jgi:hypothetical protein
MWAAKSILGGQAPKIAEPSGLCDCLLVLFSVFSECH